MRIFYVVARVVLLIQISYRRVIIIIMFFGKKIARASSLQYVNVRTMYVHNAAGV